MIATFSSNNFHQICDDLASRDADLALVLQTYGYPPMWTRTNTFETLVHIILEQQVSLASALATLNKLKERVIDITPEVILTLTDEELKACYLSRQKTAYVRHLATAIVGGEINLISISNQSNDQVRDTLHKLKGVGNWTIDVYLIFALQRTDIFPIGDLAAVNAVKQLKKIPADTPREQLLDISLQWKPYRTIATMVLWHYYLSSRKKIIKVKALEGSDQ